MTTQKPEVSVLQNSPYIPPAKTVDWRTPPEVISLVHEVFEDGIDLDPCAGTSVLARRNIRLPENGLEVPWEGTVFVNPPFQENKDWFRKCDLEAFRAQIILLSPARTDTKYWHEFVPKADAVCFWKGRLKFQGAKNSAPFPVALIYWGDYPAIFRTTFREHGWCI